jgi:hypothetical protein
MLREQRREGDNGKSSEKNPCGIMLLCWNEIVSQYSKGSRNEVTEQQQITQHKIRRNCVLLWAVMLAKWRVKILHFSVNQWRNIFRRCWSYFPTLGVADGTLLQFTCFIITRSRSSKERLGVTLVFIKLVFV